MVDGTYNAVMQTPMGTMEAKVVLKTNGNNLSGFVKGNKISTSFNNGTINNNQIKVSGMIRVMFFNINYIITGKADGETLDLVANTNKGAFKIKGQREKGNF